MKTKNNHIAITIAMILAALLLCFADTIAQDKAVPFFSLGGSNKGAIIQAGAFYERIEVNAQFKPTLSSNVNNNVLSASIGYKVLDWFTPSIGAGYYYRTDFTAYDNDPTGKTGFTKVSGISPIYGLEIRHTWWFVGISHCNQTFYSAGFKFHRKFKESN